MNSKNLAVIEGGNLALTVHREDPTAISATLVLKLQGSDETIQVTDNYDGEGKADVSLVGDNTSQVGVYDYQINENFASGNPDKYPNPDKCSGTFSFPTITIYNSLDEVES